MPERPNNSYTQGGRATRRRRGVSTARPGTRMMPASSFYVLAAAGAIATFFVIWGVLHDGHEETPWIGAGLGASIVLGSAVFIREILMIRTRRRIREAEKKLDISLSAFPASMLRTADAPKLSLERNTSLIKRIKRKSDAAKVLGTLSDGHREVFELCDEYLRLIEAELPTVAIGSPRLAAFRHGRDLIGGYHRLHLMKWAEIEARSFTQKQDGRDRISDRLKNARQAVGVVDFALRYYPEEPELVESLDVLNGLVDTLKVQELVEKAEKAIEKGNKKRARILYSDALAIVERSDLDGDEEAADKIRSEIEKLDQVLSAPDTDAN